MCIFIFYMTDGLAGSHGCSVSSSRKGTPEKVMPMKCRPCLLLIIEWQKGQQ